MSDAIKHNKGRKGVEFKSSEFFIHRVFPTQLEVEVFATSILIRF